MKARVRGNGEIVNVIVKEIPQYCIQGENTCRPSEYLITRFYDGENYYRYDELDFDVESFDYWTRLEHQYAGMAMQGMLSNEYVYKLYLDNKDYPNGLLNDSITIAHALVEKMKKKEE